MKRGSILLLGLLTSGFGASAVRAQIFTWVDEAGTVHFSQAPSSQVFRAHNVEILSDRPPPPILGGIEEPAPMTPAEVPPPAVQPGPAEGEPQAPEAATGGEESAPVPPEAEPEEEEPENIPRALDFGDDEAE